MLRYDQLQSVIGKLRFKDDSALREIGLAKLATSFDAYPLLDGGEKLYCLLPKGMDSNSAKKLAIGAARQKIIVLKVAGRGLAKVWPSVVDDEPAPPPAAPAPVAAPAAPAPAKPQATEAAPGDIEIVEE